MNYLYLSQHTRRLQSVTALPTGGAGRRACGLLGAVVIHGPLLALGYAFY